MVAEIVVLSICGFFVSFISLATGYVSGYIQGQYDVQHRHRRDIEHIHKNDVENIHD